MKDAAAFRRMDRSLHLGDKKLRQNYVTTMFNIVAPRYDDFTRYFSFGMDRRWKAELIDTLAGSIRSDACIVDLACGTGDFALALAPRAPDGRTIGLDAAENMIRQAQARLAARPLKNCSFAVADMTRTGLPDNSADVITIGYGLRNAPDLDAALHEVARILKPGGTAVSLDFVQPPKGAWRALFLGYLGLAGWAFGTAWHGNGKTYSYIAESIRRFVTSTELITRARAVGLIPVRHSQKLLGGIFLVRWTKTSAPL